MPTNTKKAYPAQYMKHLFIFIITLLTYSQILAQGCSDAGFCSLGDLKNHNEPDSSRKSISVGLNYGLGEEGTSTINSYLEYTQMLGNRFAFQSKITATYAAGFLGSNFTIGDLFATLTYKPAISGKNDLNFIGGLKETGSATLPCRPYSINRIDLESINHECFCTMIKCHINYS